jgi:hypothetical protein
MSDLTFQINGVNTDQIAKEIRTLEQQSAKFRNLESRRSPDERSDIWG